MMASALCCLCMGVRSALHTTFLQTTNKTGKQFILVCLPQIFVILFFASLLLITLELDYLTSESQSPTVGE